MPEALRRALGAYKATHNFSEGQPQSPGRSTMGDRKHREWIMEQNAKQLTMEAEMNNAEDEENKGSPVKKRAVEQATS